jgi:hypothetical protein
VEAFASDALDLSSRELGLCPQLLYALLILYQSEKIFTRRKKKMAISPDIQRAIEIIDQRIQSLQRIKEMLLKEFGIEEPVHAGRKVNWDQIPGTEPEAKKTRKEFLVDFLRKHGPQTRKEIREKTKFPLGTIAFLLNDKETFQHLPDGKWTAR